MNKLYSLKSCNLKNLLWLYNKPDPLTEPICLERRRFRYSVVRFRDAPPPNLFPAVCT